MSNTTGISQVYLDPAESKAVKQNSVTRQLLEHAQNRSSLVTVLDYGGKGDDIATNDDAFTN